MTNFCVTFIVLTTAKFLFWCKNGWMDFYTGKSSVRALLLLKKNYFLFKLLMKVSSSTLRCVFFPCPKIVHYRDQIWLWLLWKYCIFVALFKEFTAWKVPTFGVFSGPYFPAFGLNTGIYGVNLRIQSECRKIQTRKNSVLGHFSRSDSSTEPSHNFISLLFSIWMPLTIVITSTITTLSLSIAKYTQGWI